MRFRISLIVGFLVLMSAAGAAPKPWQWTTTQATQALMRHGEDFYVVDGSSRDLSKTVCRGKGKAVQRRFVAFSCTATVIGTISQGTTNLRVVARTRVAGGLCWAVVPTTIPSGCLVRGKRAEGSVRDAWIAAYRVIDDRYAQGGRCLAHGAGFFSCSWTDAQGPHRGTVVFSPKPVVRVIS